MDSEKYKAVGASASKKGLHSARASAGYPGDSDLFAPVNNDLSADDRYRTFLHCDGAGTKSIIAYLLARETGSIEHYAGLAVDALVMNIDDILCIGKPERLLLANQIARNAKLIGDDVLAVLLRSYRIQLELLNQFGLNIELAGGETADCGDVVRTLLVDAVLAGRVAKENLINTSAISPGDVIVGLSSTGKASYETSENSGIGSNGLTLARHALLKNDYLKKYPEIVAPEISQSHAYSGPFWLSDKPDKLSMAVGDALLSPTRTYAPILLKLFETLKKNIHAIIHLTGGGQTKILRFGKNLKYLKDNLFPTPPLFSLIQQHGKVDWKEMYQVFNMGHRLEIYIPEKYAAEIIKIAESFSVEARIVGRVEALPGGEVNVLILDTKNGSFEYSL